MMALVRRWGTVAAVLAAWVLLAPVARAAEPVDVPWTTLLPALPSPNGTTGGPQPRCRSGKLRCVRQTIRRLAARERHFGCDHRAVFATTYKTLTQVMLRTMKADPAFFYDRRGIVFQVALFSDIYFRTLTRYRLGQPVDDAWKIALDAAADGDVQGAGDMLLGINAHVQNDMPFMLAAITLRNAKGHSRKDDHDAENRILDDAFDEVAREVGRRYDPLATTILVGGSPVTDVFGAELVKTWREGVWRNAERLVNAKSAEERTQVADSIHLQAAVTAQSILAAARMPPGYRATRDAYCAANRLS